MEQVNVGIIGMGTVGGGVARLLTEQKDRISRRAARPVRLKWGIVRDLKKDRGLALDGVRIGTDPRAVLDDPQVSIVVETMGGTDAALKVVLAALAAGKHV